MDKSTFYFLQIISPLMDIGRPSNPLPIPITICLVIWTFACLVLSNAYRGGVTTQSIAPTLKVVPENVDALFSMGYTMINPGLFQDLKIRGYRIPITLKKWALVNTTYDIILYHLYQDWKQGIFANLSDSEIDEFEAVEVYYKCQSMLPKLKEYNQIEVLEHEVNACNVTNGISKISWDLRLKYKSFAKIAEKYQIQLESQYFGKLLKMYQEIGNHDIFETFGGCQKSALVHSKTILDPKLRVMERNFGTRGKNWFRSKPIISIPKVAMSKDATGILSEGFNSFVQSLLQSGLINFWKNLLKTVKLHSEPKNDEDEDFIQGSLEL